MSFQKSNNITGWVVFGISLIVYTLTLERSVSFWDCGEFIAAIDKFYVVHQPGAPLFLIVGKIFSLLALGNVEKIAFWTNFGSAVMSSATILFLFWTTSHIIRKILNISISDNNINPNQKLLILGGATIGALSFAFSDSFWFSAVETEVYAMSSFCTAFVFWAILKWEAHANEPKADRWIVVIAFVIGLSLGIHLLNLLVIPAIALVYHFKRSSKITIQNTFKALLVGCGILAFIQFGLLNYMVKLSQKFELYFVNDLGFEFGSGVIFYLVLVLAVFIALLLYSIKQKKYILNLSLICLGFILFGFTSYTMIVIRAKADLSINISKPENAFAFTSYLNREQYGSAPLLQGQYFDSKFIDKTFEGVRYVKGKDKYQKSGYNFGEEYDKTTLFPRIFSDQPSHIQFYRDWLNLAENQEPTFSHNIKFFLTYQVGYMYLRYFLWNFVGRQNDEQGYGDVYAGNWISGIDFFDNARLNLVSTKDQPKYLRENYSRNTYFFLPLILGLMGLMYSLRHNKKTFAIISVLFFFTGVAIVFYLNQTPVQARERDYSFVGSFYFFCIWIGIGVVSATHYISRYIKSKNNVLYSLGLCFLLVPGLLFYQNYDDHDRSYRTIAKDMAYNYLISCEPNAILFTYGDNDTYPLWYLQDVEGVRTDVRIVNLSLIATDWYIDQLKKDKGETKAIPITMEKEQYIEGVRDVLYYDNESIWAEEYKDIQWIYKFLFSDDENKQLELLQYDDIYEFENYLPTQKWQMKIDTNEMITKKVVYPQELPKVDTLMQWEFPNRLITKGDIAIVDLLIHNQWERPVYFATTIPGNNFLGLNKYLHNEGFVYRLLPLIPDTIHYDEEERVRSKIMLKNLTKKYKFGNMKNAKHLDAESRRMVSIVGTQYLVLIESLMKEEKFDEAKVAIESYFKNIPEINSGLEYYQIRETYLLTHLFKLGMKKHGKKLFRTLLNKVSEELEFHYLLSRQKGYLSGYRSIQLGVAILEELVFVAKKNEMTTLGITALKTYEEVKKRFYSLANMGRNEIEEKAIDTTSLDADTNAVQEKR